MLAAVLTAASTSAQVVISEIMADNREAWRDDDGASSDWIELFNSATTPVGVHGLYLSDRASEPTLWKLPPVAIAGRGFLVVACSGKDRRDPSRPLHTNFKLSRKRGRVTLVDRDGSTVLSRLEYGRQQTDRSYGFAQPIATSTLLSGDAEGRYLVPDSSTAEIPTGRDFDDQPWTRGRGGFGFDLSGRGGLAGLLNTNVEHALRGNGGSIYYRYAFEVPDPSQFDLAELRMQFDAGCVVFLNGREVARFRAPAKVNHKSVADLGVELGDPMKVERVLLEDPAKAFEAGRNVLAVHGLTAGKFATTHCVRAEIVGHVCTDLADSEPVYLDVSTPGRPNGPGLPAWAKAPRIEPAGALFRDSVRVRIEPRGDGVQLRYTLDGSDPSRRDAACESELQIDRSCLLKVRAFIRGRQPSEVVTAAFTRMAPELAGHASNLPQIVVSTGSEGIHPKTYTAAHLHVVEVGAPDGRSRLLDAPQFSGFAGIKTRGSSSLERPKKSYGIELRDGVGEDRDVALLGMPAASEWVLYGPHNWDLAHLRNPLCYELARRIGLDAPRTRFVELFVNTASEDLSDEDYVGLYVLIEKIELGAGRLDLEKLDFAAASEPEITGGYILKVDRPGPGDVGFEAKGQRLQYVEPKERNITDAQRAWLQQHFDRFGGMLDSEGFADEVSGYPAWIDRENWIDYHLFNEFVKNPDAYTLSTYLHKDRGGKIRMGPVWDYDRGIRTNDRDYWVGRPSRPTGWTGDCYYSWWGVLFRDAEFRRRYRARGRELLASVWSDDEVFALIDELAATIAEAEERDRRRWPILRSGEWFDEIEDMKTWVSARGAWFRDELLEVPELVVSDPKLVMPFTVTMALPDPRGTLYYTTDGADPRLASRAVSPRARVYDGPIQVAADMHLRARMKLGDQWSREADRWFASRVAQLAVTELMYNPSGGRDYEFVELANFGDEPVDLSGVDLRGAVRFHFGLGTIKRIAPGERVVIVRDLKKFAERYDVTKIKVAGTFMGRFSNTAGELRVLGSVGQELARIKYDDGWYPKTDRGGRSLVATAFERVVTEKGQWRESAERHGSPGR